VICVNRLVTFDWISDMRDKISDVCD